MAFLILEATRSNGSQYRLSLGWVMPPIVASALLLLVRLF
jgi:hypothetical protein